MAADIIRVDKDNQGQLYDYCSKYAIEHDSSNVPGRDFDLSEEHPSYLLMENDQVVGAVSLMRTKRFLSVGKGRFSIFHANNGDQAVYKKLLEAILPHMDDLQNVFMFIPEKNEVSAGILNELGFEIERYSFILERSEPALSEPVFPEGFIIHPLDPVDQEGISQFAACLNEEFKELAGHTRSTAEDIQTWFEDQSYIEGGMCLLKKEHDPVGTISMTQDLDDMDAGEIMAFGILEKYRGLDLGRNLLRYGINYLIGKGLKPIILSVNGENHGAINLYEKEGFILTESVVCYALAN
jgi:mycothiol synthase